MKHSILIILVSLSFTFVLAFLYFRIAGPIPLSVSSVTTQKTDTFAVTGEGKSYAVPDIAMVTLGVQTQGQTVKQTQGALNTTLNAVTEAIKKVGVDANDIRTSNYSLYPTIDYQGSTQRITGYAANATLTIRVRDLDKTNSVVDGATQAGANTVQGVSFEVSDPSLAQDKARKEAVAEAKKKAKEAAAIAGFSLGRIVNYSEDFGSQVRPMPFMAKSADAGGVGAGTQVQPGTNEITLTVTLNYELK